MDGSNKPAAMIRVLLVAVPPLMADVIRGKILAQPDVAIVDEVSHMSGLSAIVREQRVNVVITALAGKEVPVACQELVFGAPHVTLIAISKDAHDVDVYERKVVRKIAVDQVVQMLREVVHSNTVPQ